MKMVTVNMKMVASMVVIAASLGLLAACSTTKTAAVKAEPAPIQKNTPATTTASANAVVETSATSAPAPKAKYGKRHRGVCLYSSSALSLSRAESDKALLRIKEIGVDSVSLVISWYQTSSQSDEIQPAERQWTEAHDQAFGHAIDEAHRQGMQVMVKPHLEVKDGTYRGDIGASQSWFKSYGAFILKFAGLAEKHNAEMLCIGTELENISFSGWQTEWDALIKEIRGVYKGKLTYAANWTEYQTVCFWEQMDFVGIDAYFPLTEKSKPTQAELAQAWSGIMDKIGAWRTQNKIEKPILFTEVGYQSADQTNVTPWLTKSREPDQDEQAMALEALFGAASTREWFQGLYYWKFHPNEIWRPLDFTIEGKKAEDVMKKWYKQEG